MVITPLTGEPDNNVRIKLLLLMTMKLTQGTNGNLDPTGSTYMHMLGKNTTYETRSSPTQICVEKDNKTPTFTRTLSKMSSANKHHLNIFHHVACMWPR